MAFTVRALALLLLLSSGAVGATRPAPEAAKMRAFADELFDDGEYFRASTEYMRLLSYEPDTADHEQVKFRISQCSYRAERYDEAAQGFLRLSVATTSTSMVDRCRLVMAACRYRQEDFTAAGADCGRAIYASPHSPLLDRFTYMKGLCHIHGAEWKQAFGAFVAVPGESALSPSSRELAALSARAEKDYRFDPLMTGTLSLVVPGLGQAVCGYSMDGFTAFLLSAGSLAIGISGSVRGNKNVATAGYTLFGLWHAANIIGGANSARRANKQANKRIIGKADSLSMLSLD